MIMLPPVTALSAGALVILQMVLQMMVTFGRGKHDQGLGDGGHKALEVSIRRHGNLIENAAILLIVLWLMEIGRLGRGWLLAFAAMTVLGRIFHAIGVTVSPDVPHPLRFIGAMSTVLLGVVGGVWFDPGRTPTPLRKVCTMASKSKSETGASIPSTQGTQLFDRIVEAFERSGSDVERVKLFGYDCLRAAGKVFSKVGQRASDHEAAQAAHRSTDVGRAPEPYDGKRGEMKLWVVVDSIDEQLVIDLAREAKVFAGG